MMCKYEIGDAEKGWCNHELKPLAADQMVEAIKERAELYSKLRAKGLNVVEPPLCQSDKNGYPYLEESPKHLSLPGGKYFLTVFPRGSEPGRQSSMEIPNCFLPPMFLDVGPAWTRFTTFLVVSYEQFKICRCIEWPGYDLPCRMLHFTLSGFESLVQGQLQEIEEMEGYGMHVRQLVVRRPVNVPCILDKLCRKSASSRRRCQLQPLCALGWKEGMPIGRSMKAVQNEPILIVEKELFDLSLPNPEFDSIKQAEEEKAAYSALYCEWRIPDGVAAKKAYFENNKFTFFVKQMESDVRIGYGCPVVGLARELLPELPYWGRLDIVVKTSVKHMQDRKRVLRQKTELIRVGDMDMVAQADLMNFIIASRNKMETHRWNGFCKNLREEFFDELRNIEMSAVQFFQHNLDVEFFCREFYSLFSI